MVEKTIASRKDHQRLSFQRHSNLNCEDECDEFQNCHKKWLTKKINHCPIHSPRFHNTSFPSSCGFFKVLKFEVSILAHVRVSGTKEIAYNRMKFLCESLGDLDRQLRALGGRLWVFRSDPCVLVSQFKSRFNLTRLSFGRDTEAVWLPRDDSVRHSCSLEDVEVVERVSHTLWDPSEVINANGGTPPLTLMRFLEVADELGEPPRPVASDGVLRSGRVEFFDLASAFANDPEMLDELGLFPGVPEPEELGFMPEFKQETRQYEGGETRALALLKRRLEVSRGMKSSQKSLIQSMLNGTVFDIVEAE
jgi:hypothetical protein